MVLPSSATVPGSRVSIATPICASSVCIVRTSFRRGTLVRTSGSEVSSEAHNSGNAAFLAPETRTSPRSGTPPSMTRRSTSALVRPCGFPLRGGQRGHRQGVNFLAHPVAERRIDELVLANLRQSFEARADDQRFPVLAVAANGEVLAGQMLRDGAFDRFGGDHGQWRNFQPRRKRASVSADSAAQQQATSASESIGATSECPKKP